MEFVEAVSRSLLSLGGRKGPKVFLHIDSVRFIGSFDPLFEFEVACSWVEAHPPGVFCVSVGYEEGGEGSELCVPIIGFVAR